MTTENDKWRLTHIIEAIETAEEYLKGLTRDKFLSNYQLQCVFFRQIEVIGEAANKLSADLKDKHKEVEWRKVIGMRNRMVHGYFEVDVDILWGTIQSGLPVLKSQIEKILKEL